MNAEKTIATAQISENLSLKIVANAYGWHVIAILHRMDNAEVWDYRIHNTAAKARAAANREFLRLRKAEAAKAAA